MKRRKGIHILGQGDDKISFKARDLKKPIFVNIWGQNATEMTKVTETLYEYTPKKDPESD